jgi:uncharacterized protein YkwD
MRWLSPLLIATTLVFSFFILQLSAQSSPFYSDVSESFWAKEEIKYISNKGIMKGYKDGTFRPQVSITREQTAIIIVRALNLNVKDRPDPHFKDVSKTSTYYNYIAAVADEKIMTGSNNRFYPKNTLSRAEMAAILTRAFGLTYSSSYTFKDISPDHWAYNDIQSLAANGVTIGYNDTSYRPGNTVTRGQFAVFLARILEDSFKSQEVAKIQEIREKWQQFKPSFSENPFVEDPQTDPPYRISTLHQHYLKDALNMTNFARYLAGVPSDLTLSKDLNHLAAHGSLLLSVSNFSHYPNKPPNMSDEFYEKGYKSTSSSNIGMSKYYSYSDLSNVLSNYVKYFLIDFGENNLSKVGHRLHILNPNLKEIGFGYVTKDNYQFITMHVMDRSRKTTVDYDTITYPTRDYFPIEFIRNDIPWSITLSPSNYSLPILEEVSVSLTRENDGRVWNFNSSDNTITPAGKYFNITNNTIIFRPNDIVYKPNDRFSIKISGVKKINANYHSSIYYPVKLIKLEQ